MRVDMLLRIINPYTRDRRIANPSGRRAGFLLLVEFGY